MDLSQGVDCRECRAAHFEADTDPPCDELTKDPVTGELAHRCKYGLVDLLPENWGTWNAYRYLRVFGPDAGLLLLRAAIGNDGLAEIAEELVLLQSAQNGRDEDKQKARMQAAKNKGKR